MDWRIDFLEKVDAYCSATGRARSGVAKAILNDPKFFDEIEEGRSCTVDTKEKVEKWLLAQKPKTNGYKAKDMHP